MSDYFLLPLMVRGLILTRSLEHYDRRCARCAPRYHLLWTRSRFQAEAWALGTPGPWPHCRYLRHYQDEVPGGAKRPL